MPALALSSLTVGMTLTVLAVPALGSKPTFDEGEWITFDGPQNQTHLKRSKRFALLGAKWQNPSTLTYKIFHNSKAKCAKETGLEKELCTRLSQCKSKMCKNKRLKRKVLKNAMKAWENVNSRIKFTEKRGGGSPDIYFMFAKNLGRSTNGFAKNQIMCSPNCDIIAKSVIGFNDEKVWTDKLPTPWGESYLLSTALHEIGHALGLEHSNVRRALMYWANHSGRSVGKLHQDDIDGIRAIYPPGTGTGCTDERDTCSSWKRKYGCNHGRFGSFIRRMCKKTCGICVSGDDDGPNFGGH